MKHIVAICILACLMPLSAAGTAGSTDTQNRQKQTSSSPPVELDLYMMSQCPFAIKALPDIKKLSEDFGDHLKVNINYIGQIQKGKPASMHGENEVQGNIDQLCARVAAPSDKEFWAYMDCVIAEWRDIPANDVSCAESAGLTMKNFKNCQKGKGKKLLKKSFQTAIKVEATGSPTFFINGEKYAGNRSSQAMARHICAKHNPDRSFEFCNTLTLPPEVTVYAITDTRCGSECSVERQITSLNDIFLGLKPQVLDWSNPQAKQMMKTTGTDKLPAFLFTESVTTDEAGYDQMQRWLTKAGSYYTLKVKATFDPNAEICDNQKDDTGNGKVDCNDESCSQHMACRSDRPNQLELFMMSQCPYANKAVLAMKTINKAFKKDPDIQLKLHFIGSEVDGELRSMHGESEVEEDMRLLCVQKEYPDDFLNYATCRAKNFKNDKWKKCAKGKIKGASIASCVQNEGENLLRADFKQADALGITASPTWIANGRHQFSGITPKKIQENYCIANPGQQGCSKSLPD
ncbi:MAG: thioredoxin domain-containing protein [Deltaproteobacteria bacterium]|nr:thioredoxin domain-containing protein [Deltaproteobacteria bacterium]